MSPVTPLLAAHLEQYLRASLTAAARAAGLGPRDLDRACPHDFALTREWAIRRRLPVDEVLGWAAARAACDHELLERLG
jgi:hypothetical protein